MAAPPVGSHTLSWGAVGRVHGRVALLPDLGHAVTTLRWPAEPPTLDGIGIRLRAWGSSDADADADAVLAACQDPEIQRWTTVPMPYLRSHAVGFVGTMAPEQWVARTGALFCIASPDDDRMLGSCGLVTVDHENQVGEVGYWVAPEARHSGVARRAAELLSSWAFGDVGLHRLEISVDPNNVASVAVAEGLGYVREGVLRGKVLARGTRVDMALYALVEDSCRP